MEKFEPLNIIMSPEHKKYLDDLNANTELICSVFGIPSAMIQPPLISVEYVWQCKRLRLNRVTTYRLGKKIVRYRFQWMPRFGKSRLELVGGCVRNILLADEYRKKF